MDSIGNAADSLAASERRLGVQSDALTELTARYTNPGEQFGDRLRSILESAARAIDVERLSMWEFDARHSLIRCVGLHLRNGNRRAAIGAIVNGGYQSAADQVANASTGAPFGIQIDGGRSAFAPPVADLQP